MLGYIQFKQLCGQTPLLECVLGEGEQEAQAAWERVAETTSKGQIEGFLKKFARSSLGPERQGASC